MYLKTVSKYMKQKLTDLKEERNTSAISVTPWTDQKNPNLFMSQKSCILLSNTLISQTRIESSSDGSKTSQNKPENT